MIHFAYFITLRISNYRVIHRKKCILSVFPVASFPHFKQQKFGKETQTFWRDSSQQTSGDDDANIWNYCKRFFLRNHWNKSEILAYCVWKHSKTNTHFDFNFHQWWSTFTSWMVFFWRKTHSQLTHFH